MKFCLTALAILGFSMATGIAKPKEIPLPPPPPMTQGQIVSIYLGQSVEVPLRAIGRAASPLKFIIRTPPQHGHLGEIQLTSNKTAVVTYTHDEESGLAPDSFTFAVQGIDGPVSASSIINIIISEEPPAFSVVHSLEFPRIWQGESAEQEITLKNTGGGVLQGKVTALAPWKIIGNADYSLARKQETKIRVQFAPKDAGEFEDRLSFSHDGQASVTLKGEAQAPFEFAPSKKLELSSQGDEVARIGKLSIHNMTTAERTLKISVPPEIAAPPEVTVGAGEEKEITLRTNKNFLGALEGSVTLASDGFSQDLALHVFALEPQLKFQPAAGIAFGEIQSDRRYKSTLTLTNVGGDSAHIRATLPKGILVQPDPNSEILKAGETRIFEVAFESSGEGLYQGTIEIAAEGGRSISVPVTAKITLPPTVPEKTEPATLTPKETKPLPEPDAEKANYNDNPVVAEIKTLKTGKYEVEIGWKKPAPNVVSYVLEVRTLTPTGGGPPKARWTEWHEVKFLEENGLSIARVEHLHPGQTLFFRVSSIGDTGKRSRPSEIIRLSSPSPHQIDWGWWLGGILMMGGIAFLVARTRKQKQLEASRDAARLAQIEGH